MKFLKTLSLVLSVAMISLVACKNEKAATEETKVAPATTTTSTTTNTPPTNEPAIPAGPLTKIDFPESTYDYGEIMDGEEVIHDFSFKNTGDEPLIISNAKGSCGCTVPEWPREPIAPGESGVIKVKFASKGKGKVGGNLQSKRVTITANTDPVNTYLTIKGKVNKEPGTEEATPATPPTSVQVK